MLRGQRSAIAQQCFENDFGFDAQGFEGGQTRNIIPHRKDLALELFEEGEKNFFLALEMPIERDRLVGVDERIRDIVDRAERHLRKDAPVLPLHDPQFAVNRDPGDQFA
jgi:hypothetical protein